MSRGKAYFLGFVVGMGMSTFYYVLLEVADRSQSRPPSPVAKEITQKRQVLDDTAPPVQPAPEALQAVGVVPVFALRPMSPYRHPNIVFVQPYTPPAPERVMPPAQD